MANPQNWPTQKEHIDYYARFCRRLEQIAQLSQAAVLNRSNAEYMKECIRLIKLHSETLTIEAQKYETLRAQEISERNRVNRQAGAKGAIRGAHWVVKLVGFKNNSDQDPGLIRELTERIADLFSDKELAKATTLTEASLDIIRQDTNYILSIFAKHPQPGQLPRISDLLTRGTEKFLGSVPDEPAEACKPKNSRQKTRLPGKTKHARRVGGKRKRSEADIPQAFRDGEQ